MAFSAPVELPAAALLAGLDDVRAGAQIRGRELVELGPAVRDELAALLHHRVEPRQHEQHLRAHHGALLHVLHAPALVGPQQVLLEAGRRLEGHLERLLQQDRRELRVRLRRQPEPAARALQTVSATPFCAACCMKCLHEHDDWPGQARDKSMRYNRPTMKKGRTGSSRGPWAGAN